MSNPTLPINEELLEVAARTVAVLPAREVEPALARAASQYAKALSEQRPDLTGYEIGTNARHFAFQVARRARAIILNKERPAEKDETQH